ncbi:MAG TPA: hypothetical protein VNK96_04620 [Fimbriimonadales bacterium]|nr:hypothetical protein [Fimbriimonadales bacterium]
MPEMKPSTMSQSPSPSQSPRHGLCAYSSERGFPDLVRMGFAAANFPPPRPLKKERPFV